MENYHQMKKRKSSEDQEGENKTKKKKKEDQKDESLIIYLDKTLVNSVGGKDITQTLKDSFYVEIQENQIPFSITFENEKMKKYTKTIIRWNGDVFIEEIETIHSKFSKYKDHQLFFIVEGLDKCLKNMEKNVYQEIVKGNKKVAKVISNEKIESIILKLQLELRINFTFTNSIYQTKDFIALFITKFQKEKKEMGVLDFKTSTRAPKNLKESYKNHLMELVTERVADAIISKYPTLRSLVDEYRDSDKTESEKKELLSSIECVYESGRGRVEETKKKIGKKISEKVYLFYK